MNEMEIRDKFLAGNRAKIKLAWFATIAVVVATAVFSFYFFAEAEAPRRDWVIDSAGILSDATIAHINERNNVLRDEMGTEFLVVVERDSSNNRNLGRRADNLFSQHNVSENGMLLIMAVPESQSGIGGFISGIVDSIAGGRYAYWLRLGRNADDTLDHRIERDFADAFFAYYDAGNFNMAIRSMVDNIYYNHFGGADLASIPAPSTPGMSTEIYAPGIQFVSVAAIIILALFMIMIFSRRRRVHTPFRVYRSPRWFGFGGHRRMRGFGTGFGMGMGAGMMMSNRNNRNRNMRGGGFGGSSRTGGGGGSGRSGGSSRGSGFGSSSGRSGGSSRGGGFGGSRGGGMSRGGGSRGGGRRR